MNKLYFMELVISNDGSYHDELIDITIRIPKDNITLDDDFPVPQYEFLEKYKEGLIDELYQIKKIHNVNKYESIDDNNSTIYAMPLNFPLGLMNYYRESYEELKEDYIDKINYVFDYEVTEESEYIYLKHSQKIIKPNENILFPCRIFLKEKIEEVEYTINSKLSEKIVKGILKID